MSFREREKKAGFLADQHHRPVQSEAVEEAAQQRCSGTLEQSKEHYTVYTSFILGHALYGAY
jgi:hypothetical protein